MIPTSLADPFPTAKSPAGAEALCEVSQQSQTAAGADLYSGMPIPYTPITHSHTPDKLTDDKWGCSPPVLDPV